VIFRASCKDHSVLSGTKGGTSACGWPGVTVLLEDWRFEFGSSITGQQLATCAIRLV